MPCRLASWPVVGTFFGPTPAFFRAMITTFARLSLASTVALISGCAVYCCWKIVAPSVDVQFGVIWSPTKVQPLELVVPGVCGVFVFPQITELYPWAKEIAFGSVSSPPLSTKIFGLETPHAVTQALKPWPISGPTLKYLKLVK